MFLQGELLDRDLLQVQKPTSKHVQLCRFLSFYLPNQGSRMQLVISDAGLQNSARDNPDVVWLGLS